MGHIKRAEISDASELLVIQKLAYKSVAEIEGYEILPLRQSVEDIEEAFKEHVILKYVCNGKIIGSVRGLEKDGTCWISRLMVHPDYENQGIGRELMKSIEEMFEGIRYELFTATINTKNISFYEKLGYKGYRTGMLPGIETLFIFMEKEKTRA